MYREERFKIGISYFSERGSYSISNKSDITLLGGAAHIKHMDLLCA